MHNGLTSTGDDLFAHLLSDSRFLWSWPAHAPTDPSLPVFAFPSCLFADRPTVHAFATSESSGLRRCGFALGWLNEGAHVLCVLTREPYDEELLYETLLIAHHRLLLSGGGAPTAALAAERVAPLLESLAALLRAHAPPHAPLRRGHEAALHGLCRSLRPTGLLQAFLCVLLEERVLLVAREPLSLFRAASALVAAMAPLDFCGAFVPLLPDGLHPRCAHMAPVPPALWMWTCTLSARMRVR
jgi:hypothetical protein